MSRKKTGITVNEKAQEGRETCVCPLCRKRAMDILNEDTIELKCPNCERVIPIPWDRAKRGLMLAEGKTAATFYGKDGKP